jgi:3-oxoacyl-[acyl-carrier protein] reductase
VTLLGKTALVTGAVGAIGAAVSRDFIREGAQVVLLDIASEPLEDLAKVLGPNATALSLDLSDAKAVICAAATLLERLGSIDILVNNAGILSNHKVADTTLDEWRIVNSVNVDAAFLLCKALLPAMRSKRWGRIVNISSYAAKCGGLTAGTAYSVSKSAMIGLTFSIARETAREGITVNAIAPAYVMSPMVSEQLTDQQREQQLAQIPVGRFCEPEEVAHAVTFLASPLAGFITGEVIDMNGGLQFD